MIGNHSVYQKNLDIAQRVLGASVLRKNVIANNIANVDTPHYKRHMVTFESELNRAIDSEKRKKVPTSTSNNRHILFDKVKDYREVGSKIHVEYDTNYRNDKNNVDIEKEIGDELKNSMHFSSIVQTMNNSFRRMRSVLNGV